MKLRIKTKDLFTSLRAVINRQIRSRLKMARQKIKFIKRNLNSEKWNKIKFVLSKQKS